MGRDARDFIQVGILGDCLTVVYSVDYHLDRVCGWVCLLLSYVTNSKYSLKLQFRIIMRTT